MAVQNIRREARDGMNADMRGDPSERAEAERVVGPVAPVVRHVRIALPAEEMRRIQDEQIEVADLRGEHARPAAEQVVDREDFVRLPEGGLHRGIAGHQRDRLDAMLAKRARQRAHDVGETAGLDERDRFPKRRREP